MFILLYVWTNLNNIWMFWIVYFGGTPDSVYALDTEHEPHVYSSM
jgi:hypothetical protein